MNVFCVLMVMISFRFMVKFCRNMEEEVVIEVVMFVVCWFGLMKINYFFFI